MATAVMHATSPDTDDVASMMPTPREVSQSTSRSRQGMVFYSQRIALLGAVTSAVGKLIAQEEAERTVLLAAMDDMSSLSSSTSAIESGFIPFEPLRVQSNGIEVHEHEDRYEIVHEESAIHREMFRLHLSLMYDLSAFLRKRQQTERAVLEREVTLRTLEIVCHWESQRQELEQLERDARQLTMHLTAQRQSVMDMEIDGRDVFTATEEVNRREMMRRFREEMTGDE